MEKWRHGSIILNAGTRVWVTSFTLLPLYPDGNCTVNQADMKPVVKFEAFTAMTMKNAVFWDERPCLL
jgi:hypothetical protein